MITPNGGEFFLFSFLAKVETIGDAYMIASGCPTRTKYHAPFIAEMALDMVTSVQLVKDESKDPPESLRIRVGEFAYFLPIFTTLEQLNKYRVNGLRQAICRENQSSFFAYQVTQYKFLINTLFLCHVIKSHDALIYFFY